MQRKKRWDEFSKQAETLTGQNKLLEYRWVYGVTPCADGA